MRCHYIFLKYTHQSFLDLTISVGAEIEKVRCHKFIVAMVSDVIQSESVMKDEIIFTNIKKDILQEIIDYCYTQMIGPFVNKSHVSPFVYTCSCFFDFWILQKFLGRKHLWWHQKASNQSLRTSNIRNWGRIGQRRWLLWSGNHRMGTHLSWYCCRCYVGPGYASTSYVQVKPSNPTFWTPKNRWARNRCFKK